MDITDKQLRFTVIGIVDCFPNDTENIGVCLDGIQEFGEAEIMKIELIEPNAPLPDLKSAYKNLEFPQFSIS